MRRHRRLFADQDIPPDLLDAAQDDLQVHRWECELVQMLEIVIAAHARSGLDCIQARRVVVTALLALGQCMGGRMAYLPRGDDLRRAIRNRLIYRQFNRRNLLGVSARVRPDPEDYLPD